MNTEKLIEASRKSNLPLVKKLLQAESELKFKKLKEASSILFGEYGRWLYDEWAKHNGNYFFGELQVPAIQCGLTPHGSSLGYYTPAFNTITMHWSLVSKGKSVPFLGKSMPFGIRPSKDLASDVLLHEMIHQYLHQTGGYKEGDDPHWCDAWISELNRLAPMMGLGQYYFTLYKRTKERGSRKNIYLPVEAAPKGMKLAPRYSIPRFPSVLRPSYFVSAS